jgi:large subunit ribosomal protein L31
MKKGIHPEYREVLFHDTSVDQYFIIPSTLNTDQTKEYKDGKTYPYYPLDVSSASHPFYTGQHKIVDTGGRVDRFKKRFAKTAGAAAVVSEKKESPAPTKEVVTEEAPAEEVIAKEVVTEEAPAEEAPAEEVVAKEVVTEEAPAEEASKDSPKEK